MRLFVMRLFVMRLFVMRLFVITVLLFFGCASTRQAAVDDDDAAADATSEADAARPEAEGIDGAAAQPYSCGVWEEDLTEKNLQDINRLGLTLSHTVAQGSLGRPVEGEYRWYASFTIEKIWQGMQFLEGLTIWVPLGKSEVDFFTLPGEYVIGFDGNAFPTEPLDGKPEGLVWWHPTVFFPAKQRASYGRHVDYRGDRAAIVALVTMASQDEYSRMQLQVVDVLKGQLPTTSLKVNWSNNHDPLIPFPPVSDAAQYIASISSGTYDQETGDYLAVIEDFRALTPESRSLVEQELASPAQLWDPKQIEAFAERYRTGWSFKRAPHVVSTRVSGLAQECCTALGGLYVAQRIVEYLQGESDRTHTVTGGHGYYGTESCGDPFLLAVFNLESIPQPGAEFTCDATSGVDPGWVYQDESIFGRRVKLEATAAKRKEVDSWLASAPPVYRIHPAQGSMTPPSSSNLEGDGALWSKPAGAANGIVAGTHPVVFRIDNVTRGPGADPEHDWHEVTISTPFYTRRLDHLEEHRVKIGFSCGDRRLLQQGAEWLGMMLFDGFVDVQEMAAEDYGRGFLVPGLLLPDLEYIERIIDKVPYEVRRAQDPP